MDFKSSHSLKSLYIRFNKETFLNDILNCSTYNTLKPNIYVHKITKDKEIVCDIQTSWTDKKTNKQIVNYDLDVHREYNSMT